MEDEVTILGLAATLEEPPWEPDPGGESAPRPAANDNEVEEDEVRAA